MYVQEDHERLLEILERVKTKQQQCSHVFFLPMNYKQIKFKLLSYQIILDLIENIPDFGTEDFCVS